MFSQGSRVGNLLDAHFSKTTSQKLARNPILGIGASAETILILYSSTRLGKSTSPSSAVISAAGASK